MYPVNATGQPQISKISVNLAVTIHSAALKPGLFDLGGQLRVFLDSGPLRAITPGVIPTGVNV